MSVPEVLRAPEEVVTAVPVLLGFHPESSVVLLWLDHHSHLVCAVRHDLGTPRVEVLRRVHALAAQTGPGRLVLLAYPQSLSACIDSAYEDDLLNLVDEIPADVATIVDVLIVCEGRFWSALCTDPDCCPIGGRLVPASTTCLEVAVVAAGQPAVASDRAEVAARYQPRTGRIPSPEALDIARDGLPGALEQRCDRALALLASHADTGLSDVALAELCWLVQDVDVRDWALAHICTPRPDHSAIDVLVDVALAAPDQLRPRAAGAAAAALFASGVSSVAVWCLVEHAGPDRLAGLVADSLEQCVPPTVLRAILAEAIPTISARIDHDTAA